MQSGGLCRSLLLTVHCLAAYHCLTDKVGVAWSRFTGCGGCLDATSILHMEPHWREKLKALITSEFTPQLHEFSQLGGCRPWCQ